MEKLLRKIKYIYALALIMLSILALCSCGGIDSGDSTTLPQTFSVSYSASVGGSVLGEINQTIKYEGNATAVTAVPNEGYKFVSWSDGVETATRTDTFVTEDIVVTAEFERLGFTVRYRIIGNGTLQGVTNQTVNYKEDATEITAIPNEGSRFVAWSDGVETATRTDTDVTRSITVIAKFEKIKHLVTYEVNHYAYGGVQNKGAVYPEASQPLTKLDCHVEHGDDAPVITACPGMNGKNESYAFLYWSDGVTTEERQDKNITSDITITAYFGYTIEYKVDGNVGGRIEGKTEQKLLPDGASEQVVAVPNPDYVFCGWSDFSLVPERSGDKVKESIQEYYNAVWVYVAYFEPIEKTFRYDYGMAGGAEVSSITLNRNDIGAAKFAVPTREGYTFCGWYADSDYRVRITMEDGKYMYGYAAFSLETDTLYARWRKEGEEADPHKVLLLFADETDVTLYSISHKLYIDVYDKMCALDYGMSKWVQESLYDILNEWFEGIVEFEVDAYFTTKTIGNDSFPDRGANALYALNVSEVFDIVNKYHNTISFMKYGDRDGSTMLANWAGLAGKKHACVKTECYWSAKPAGYLMRQDFLEGCKKGEIDLSQTVISPCLHEFAHTAEMNFDFDYDLHTAIGYAIREYRVANIQNTFKPYLLGQFEMSGEMCGVPIEYWGHSAPVRIWYYEKPINGYPAGKIAGYRANEQIISGQDSIYIQISYGSDFIAEAIPNEGYRFVKWSDGITTAIRHDVNIISYVEVAAIFEKI